MKPTLLSLLLQAEARGLRATGILLGSGLAAGAVCGVWKMIGVPAWSQFLDPWKITVFGLAFTGMMSAGILLILPVAVLSVWFPDWLEVWLARRAKTFMTLDDNVDAMAEGADSPTDDVESGN